MADLYDMFLRQAQEKYAMPTMPVISQGTSGDEREHTKYGTNTSGPAYDEYNAQRRAIENQRAQYVQQLANDWGSQQKQDIANTRTSNMQTIDAQRSTALQAMNERNAQLRSQADRVLTTPPSAPSPVPSLAPVEAVTNIDANRELAGANAAQSLFYVTPDRIQSNYSIAPAVGGGIGGRTKKSTDNLAGRSDAFGTMNKDEL